MSIDERIVLVTGAAQGIGYAIAARFASEGVQVIITDRNEELGASAATNIGAGFVHHDVSDEAGWQELIAHISDTRGALHALINNAGFEGEADLQRDPENTSLTDWDDVFRINAAGTFLGCKHAIPLLARSGGGAITNLSSVASLVPTPFLTAYGASKAAVEHLTKSVALHCAQSGYAIRCNSVHPGQARTPMLDKLFDRMAAENGVEREAFEAEFVKSIPLGRLQEPSDIANIVFFLSGNEARMITGQSIAVDGGFCLVH